MSPSDYQPWRTDDEAEDVLAADVSAEWRQLLDESRACVQRLRTAASQTDRRLKLGAQLLRALHRRSEHESQGTHERILERLDAFEQRLAALEQRLDQTPRPIPHPMNQPRNHAA